MLSNEFNAIKQLPAYQALQKLDPSLKTPKGSMQKALKWIENKVDSLSFLFRSQTDILQEKKTKLLNKFEQIDQYETDVSRMSKLFQMDQSKINALVNEKKTRNANKINFIQEQINKLTKISKDQPARELVVKKAYKLDLEMGQTIQKSKYKKPHEDVISSKKFILEEVVNNYDPIHADKQLHAIHKNAIGQKKSLSLPKIDTEKVIKDCDSKKTEVTSITASKISCIQEQINAVSSELDAIKRKKILSSEKLTRGNEVISDIESKLNDVNTKILKKQQALNTANINLKVASIELSPSARRRRNKKTTIKNKIKYIQGKIDTASKDLDVTKQEKILSSKKLIRGNEVISDIESKLKAVNTEILKKQHALKMADASPSPSNHRHKKVKNSEKPILMSSVLFQNKNAFQSKS
jgi:hypothetical protein